MRSVIVVAALGLPAAVAGAAPPIYFHKPEVARADFLADLDRCVALASGVRVERLYVYSPTAVGAAASGFFGALFAGAERRQLTSNVLRTCMADRGYRRVTLPDDVADGLRKLTVDERAERLAVLAAAADPAGEVLPR